MIVGDVLELMKPWNKIRISGLHQIDIHGQRIWTQTLSDAQKYAYWSREIVKTIVEEKTATVYCIVEDRGGNNA